MTKQSEQQRVATPTVETWPIERLSEYARNPRKNDQAVDRMVASIKEFGFKIPVLARSNGELVDGHLRLKAARKCGITEIPVILCDEWTAAQVKAFRLMVNRSVTWADWDESLLAIELKELDDLDFDLDLTGFDDRELTGLLFKEETEDEGLTDADEAPDLPEIAVSELGDMWLMGDHRLLVGDALQTDNMKRLMGDDLADMVWTDPPYGVAVASRVGVSARSSAEARQTSQNKIQNDDMPIPELTDFLRLAFRNILAATRKGACWYVAAPHGPMGVAFALTLNELDVWRHSLVWVKDSLVMSRMDYHYRHEPIYYGWTPGAPHNSVPERNQDTVWEFSRPKRSLQHPTMKPVALISRAIRNSSNRRDLVLDPFGGSGSTMIACVRQKRRVRLMEIDPKYADCIVRRYEKFTGQKAVLESDGRKFSDVAAGRRNAAA